MQQNRQTPFIYPVEEEKAFKEEKAFIRLHNQRHRPSMRQIFCYFHGKLVV